MLLYTGMVSAFCLYEYGCIQPGKEALIDAVVCALQQNGRMIADVLWRAAAIPTPGFESRAEIACLGKGSSRRTHGSLRLYVSEHAAHRRVVPCRSCKM